MLCVQYFGPKSFPCSKLYTSKIKNENIESTFWIMLMKSWNTSWNTHFIYCSNYLMLEWANLNFLTRKLLPIFNSTFNQLKMILILFLILLYFYIFTLLLVAMQQTLILYLSFFTCFCSLYLLAPSLKSIMIDSLRISVVKIFIINIGIIKGILLRAISLLKSNNIRAHITEDYVIIRKYIMIKLLSS